MPAEKGPVIRVRKRVLGFLCPNQTQYVTSENDATFSRPITLEGWGSHIFRGEDVFRVSLLPKGEPHYDPNYDQDLSGRVVVFEQPQGNASGTVSPREQIVRVMNPGKKGRRRFAWMGGVSTLHLEVIRT